MDLAAEVAKFVMRVLPYDKNNRYVTTALAQMTPGELLCHYLNWKKRLISNCPRTVFRSAELKTNPLASKFIVELAALINDIELGENLCKYLSDRIFIGFEFPAKRKKKNLKEIRYLDLLLNERGIHHLHLTLPLNGRRSTINDPLIFAIFRPRRAYLLDIRNHYMFEDDHFARVAVENWPDDELLLDLKGIHSARDGALSNEQRRKFRSLGISNPAEIGNKVYIPPGGGISSAGFAFSDVYKSDRIMWALSEFEKTALENRSKIDRFIEAQGKIPPAQFDFEFAHFQNGFGLTEKVSGALIGLNV